MYWVKRVFFPHSLGIFYQALTQFMGFPHYGDEYKVMGLAPYGKAEYLDPLREVLYSYTDGTFKLNLDFINGLFINVKLLNASI